jgi:hypothetical protein
MEITPIIWIFSVIIGSLIGSSKDRLLSGIIWSIIFGPLGVIVVLCLPNLKKQKEESERKQQLELQLKIQQEQLKKLDLINRSGASSHEQKMRIASNGEDLGELPVATIKLMLKTGKLTTQDYYYDSEMKDWMQIECNSELV